MKHQKGEMVGFHLQSCPMAEQSADSGEEEEGRVQGLRSAWLAECTEKTLEGRSQRGWRLVRTSAAAPWASPPVAVATGGGG